MRLLRRWAALLGLLSGMVVGGLACRVWMAGRSEVREAVRPEAAAAIPPAHRWVLLSDVEACGLVEVASRQGAGSPQPDLRVGAMLLEWLRQEAVVRRAPDGGWLFEPAFLSLQRRLAEGAGDFG